MQSDLITLKQLATDLGVSLLTARRWIVAGVAGVKLEHVRRGYRLFTSHAAYERFQQQVDAALASRAA